MKKAVIARKRLEFIGEISFLSLQFLNAENVRILLHEPLKKTFFGRRPNAVGIKGKNAQHALSSMEYVQIVV